MPEILKASSPSDWRPLDPENIMYIELPSGRVVIELAPDFAPNHVARISALVREGYYDHAAIIRSQDNYVVQWADRNKNSLASAAKPTLKAEFTTSIRKSLTFTRLPDGDGYAPEVGFSNGFPVARDPKSGRAWLVNCYGMVGVSRGDDADSGNATELYAIIGQAARQLDQNITVVGRVVQGMELLSTMPRGNAALGFYGMAEERHSIKSVRIVADVTPAERTDLEVFRTDTRAFDELVESRRNRPEEWFKVPAGHIDVCSVPIAVRP